MGYMRGGGGEGREKGMPTNGIGKEGLEHNTKMKQWGRIPGKGEKGKQGRLGGGEAG